MKSENIIATRPEKTIYRDGELAVKVFKKGYPKADILNEALNQARVEETGLNVPKIESVSMVDGCWAISTDFIEGKTLTELMAENPDKMDEYLNLFVDIQLEIHSKRAPLLTKLKDKFNRKINSLSGKVDATLRYELLTRLESMPKHNKVLHGDFRPSNIIIDKDGKAFIIDWAHATQGNASADAARTYLLLTLNHPEIKDKYLELFCKKSDTAIQYVRQWLPIVASTQLVKAIPEEKELLESWVDVVDYE